MKNIGSIAAIMASLSAGSTFAADLPSHKAPPPAAPVLSWTGAYAGLNAGYSWGTNSNVGSQNYAPAWTEGAPDAGQPFTNAAGPLAMSGVRSNTQSGFIGGAQFGYNYQYGTKYVFGIETDIQGTGINGSSRIGGAAAYASNYVGNDGFPGNSGTASSKGTGATVVNAGLNYLGTVRGRVGYLVTPTLMLYGTGGFTYGGAYAKVTQSAVDTLGYPVGSTIGTVYSTATWIGGGQQNQILTGWNAGGGAEWMFMPNWSLKGEALYWDLGRMNVNTSSMAAAPTSFTQTNIGWGRTSVSYQGVQAKVGVNYHFNFSPETVVAKF